MLECFKTDVTVLDDSQEDLKFGKDGCSLPSSSAKGSSSWSESGGDDGGWDGGVDGGGDTGGGEGGGEGDAGAPGELGSSPEASESLSLIL